MLGTAGHRFAALLSVVALLGACKGGECRSAPPAFRVHLTVGSGVVAGNIKKLDMILVVDGKSRPPKSPILPLTLSSQFEDGVTSFEVALSDVKGPTYTADFTVDGLDSAGAVVARAKTTVQGSIDSCRAVDLELTSVGVAKDGGTDGAQDSGPDMGKCGNAAIDTGEVCDTKLLGNTSKDEVKTCQSEGMVGGTLACKADCSAFDYSGCTWVATAGGVSGDGANAITVDSRGHVIITGVFGKYDDSSGVSIKFTDKLTKVGGGGRDVLVAGINPKGTFVWAEAGTGKGKYDEGLAVDVDSADNVYVTGRFSDTVTFGGRSYLSNGHQDIYLAKFSPAGAVVWMEPVGGTALDEGQDLVVDPRDRVLLTGPLNSTLVRFGGTWSGGFAKGNDFIARLDAQRAWNWVAQAGIKNHYSGRLAMDSQGDLCLSGTIDGTTTKVPSTGATDIVVQPVVCATSKKPCKVSYFSAKFNTAKQKYSWFKVIAAVSDVDTSRPPNVAVDADGDCYFTGTFSETVKLADKTLTSRGKNDVLVVKLAGKDGTIRWAASAGSPMEDYGADLGVDGKKNVYITGTFYGSKLESRDGRLTPLPKDANNHTMFWLKLDAQGRFQPRGRTSRGAYKGDHSSQGNAIFVDKQGNSYLAGAFFGGAAFGATAASSAIMSRGDRDLFVWKITPDGK